MTDSTLHADTASDAVSVVDGGTVGDYIALLKPRVMSLVIFTAFVGYMLAPGALHPVLGAIAILAVAVGAGASGAIKTTPSAHAAVAAFPLFLINDATRDLL